MAVRANPFADRGPTPGRTSVELRQQTESIEPACRWNKLITTTAGYISKAEIYRERKLPECPVVRITNLRDRLTRLIESFDHGTDSSPERDPSTRESDRDGSELPERNLSGHKSHNLYSRLAGEGRPGNGDGNGGPLRSTPKSGSGATGVDAQDGEQT